MKADEPPSGASRVQFSQENRQGWPDVWRISNGRVEAIVVSQIGRIMQFGFVNGPGALWENRRLDG
ncbi:MAG: hypothetical protein ACRD2G_10725, partial [Terriglobia bacterium]